MKRTILIVDDDEDLAMIASDMLIDYGYQTAYAKDGDEAYELLKDNAYDLILLDINLPFETGFEVCEELRKVSTVPVIFASARTSEDDRITGFEAGGDDYLPKPYSLKELLVRVNALMRRTYGFSEKQQPIEIGDIFIDIENRVVKKKGEQEEILLKPVLLDFIKEMNGDKNDISILGQLPDITVEGDEKRLLQVF